METLTKPQEDILVFIDKYTTEIGYPPTLQNIADFKGQWPNAAYEVLSALEKKGFITKKNFVARSCLLTERGKEAVSLINCIHEQ